MIFLKEKKKEKKTTLENTGLIISENSLSEVNIKLMYKTDKPIFSSLSEFPLIWLQTIIRNSMLKFILVKHLSLFLMLKANESNRITCILQVKYTRKYLFPPEQHCFIPNEIKTVSYA